MLNWGLWHTAYRPGFYSKAAEGRKYVLHLPYHMLSGTAGRVPACPPLHMAPQPKALLARARARCLQYPLSPRRSFQLRYISLNPCTEDGRSFDLQTISLDVTAYVNFFLPALLSSLVCHHCRLYAHLGDADSLVAGTWVLTVVDEIGFKEECRCCSAAQSACRCSEIEASKRRATATSCDLFLSTTLITIVFQHILNTYTDRDSIVEHRALYSTLVSQSA